MPQHSGAGLLVLQRLACSVCAGEEHLEEMEEDEEDIPPSWF